jgi:hypothetical protein
MTTIVVFKFQTDKCDKPYIGPFGEKIASKIILTSKKIAFRSTLITDIGTSLGGKKICYINTDDVTPDVKALKIKAL